MKSKTYKNASDLAADLGLSPERGLVAEMKPSSQKRLLRP
jgi:hypothetical protein